MDVESLHCVSGSTEGGASNQSECVSEQPVANGKLPHPCAGQAPPPASDRPQDSSDESLSSEDVSRLLPAPLRRTGVVSSSAPPIGCPPPPTNEKRPTRSPAPLKTDAAHIKEVAGNDCCVHCLLACLFCELLSICSALGGCLACGAGGDSRCAGAACCCCAEAALLDCGMLENCCASSDCLEVCSECCAIVFPS